MKVLQTLGRHSGEPKGVFQYRRDHSGVRIDPNLGKGSTGEHLVLTHREWELILEGLRTAPWGSFRLTEVPNPPEPPWQSLHALLSDQVPHPENKWSWTDSIKSYVCAILENEGSIYLYHGMLGNQHRATLTFGREISD